MSNQPHEFRARLRKLREHYLEQLPAKRDSIAKLQQAILDGDSVRANIEELRFIAHTLAGSGGSFGLHALSKRARPLDMFLKQVLDTWNNSLNTLQLEQLTLLINELLAVQTDNLDDEILELAQELDVDASGIVKQILVLDNDNDALNVIHQATGSQVCQLDPMADRETIIESIREFAPGSIFITNLAMQKNAAARDVIHALQQSGVEIPVILINEYDKSPAQSVEMHDKQTLHLNKPLDIAQIRQLEVFRGRLAEISSDTPAPSSRGEFNEGTSPSRGTTASEATILYIEDNPVNSKFVNMVIAAECGYTLVIRETAESALEYLDTVIPDLILLDINLPGIDGYAAYRGIRQRPALQNVPVIALSGNTSDADRKRAVEAGFDAYLTKPVNIGKLLDTINAFILLE